MTEKDMFIFRKAFYLGLNAALRLKKDIESAVQVGPKLQKTMEDSIYRSEQKAQSQLEELPKYLNQKNDYKEAIYNIENDIPNMTPDFKEVKDEQ